ncbi:MAG TPA: tetratricopeptide repeat protein [Anaeromyxobacteraceae bacterium]|nr:tetratricopeptide repeat protein [Anaeromyxobacteraceae bacterium]
MRATVLKDPALVKLAGRFVRLEIDTEKPGNAPFLERFPIEVWPTFLVVDPATEKAMLKWPGTATPADLVKLLGDGERAVKGGAGEGPEAILARADRENASGNEKEAIRLWRLALERGGPRWERRPRVLESLAMALQASEQLEACADLARKEAPGMARGQSFANVVSVGLSCALSAEEEGWAPLAREKLQPLAREAVKLPGVLADDRSALYQALFETRTAEKDAADARKLGEEWWAFLVAERARGRSGATRVMLDSWIVAAALALDDPGRALPLLLASEREEPGDYNPPYRVAELYLELKDYDKALAASDRALRLAYGPRKLRVLGQRATILERKGDPAAARRVLEDAVSYAATLPGAQRSQATLDRLQARLARMGGS